MFILSAIWENTELVQWIRCEHLIHGTCVIFSLSHTKWQMFLEWAPAMKPQKIMYAMAAGVCRPRAGWTQ